MGDDIKHAVRTGRIYRGTVSCTLYKADEVRYKDSGKSKDIAQDIVQDTFHTALLHIDTIMVHENPGGWLMKTLQNKIRENQRMRSRYIYRILSLDSDFQLESFCPETLAYQELEPEDTVSMEQIKLALTPKEFQLLKWYVFDKASHLDIAKELNITVYASQKRLQRIREKLYKAFPERKNYK